MVRLNLRDDHRRQIEHMLPGNASDPGLTGEDNRRFVEAVLWMARPAAPWRDLPVEFGTGNSVDRRVARWQKRGVLDAVFEELTKDADFEEVFLDSTIVRVHQHAAGADTIRARIDIEPKRIELPGQCLLVVATDAGPVGSAQPGPAGPSRARGVR